MKVLVCGSRSWTDGRTIFEALKKYKPATTEIITGGAQGADRIAERIARERGFALMVFPAEWKRYGRRAGPIRNQQMLEEGKPDVVLAFLAYASPGTMDMIRRARSAGVPVVRYEKEKPEGQLCMISKG